MLHKLTASSATSQSTSSKQQNALTIPPAGESTPYKGATGADLVQILSRRCSSFCAEAAVLVLVFGLLDYFMMKGHIGLPWIAGALCISLLLLTFSIAIELSAHRWIKAHP